MPGEQIARMATVQRYGHGSGGDPPVLAHWCRVLPQRLAVTLDSLPSILGKMISNERLAGHRSVANHLRAKRGVLLRDDQRMAAVVPFIAI